jgi:hypothetical protein
MGLGGILSASFRVLRRNPRPVVGFSLVLHLLLAVINIGITVLFTIGALNDYITALNTAAQTGELSKSTIASGVSSLLVAWASGFLAQLFTYAGNAILQGVITTEVARGTVGEKLPLSALWARTRGRIGPLLGWAGLVILGVLVILGILIGIEVLLFALGGTGGAIAGGILAFVFFFGSIVLGVWLSTKLSMIPSVLVIERLPLRRAIARSWTLTRGYFWRTFGIEILVAVMLAVAASIVEFPVTLIISITTQLGNPTGIATAGSVVNPLTNFTEIITEIVGALVATITAIVSTATTALIYIDLRMRKEGLDLQLMRFVDARAAGQTDVADPYLTADSKNSGNGSTPEQAA